MPKGSESERPAEPVIRRPTDPLREDGRAIGSDELEYEHLSEREEEMPEGIAELDVFTGKTIREEHVKE